MPGNIVTYIFMGLAIPFSISSQYGDDQQITEEEQCDMRMWYMDLMSDGVFDRELSSRQKKVQKTILKLINKSKSKGPVLFDCELLDSYEDMLLEGSGDLKNEKEQEYDAVPRSTKDNIENEGQLQSHVDSAKVEAESIKNNEPIDASNGSVHSIKTNTKATMKLCLSTSKVKDRLLSLFLSKSFDSHTHVDNLSIKIPPKSIFSDAHVSIGQSTQCGGSYIPRTLETNNVQDTGTNWSSTLKSLCSIKCHYRMLLTGEHLCSLSTDLCIKNIDISDGRRKDESDDSLSAPDGYITGSSKGKTENINITEESVEMTNDEPPSNEEVSTDGSNKIDENIPLPELTVATEDPDRGSPNGDTGKLNYDEHTKEGGTISENEVPFHKEMTKDDVHKTGENVPLPEHPVTTVDTHSGNGSGEKLQINALNVEDSKESETILKEKTHPQKIVAKDDSSKIDESVSITEQIGTPSYSVSESGKGRAEKMHSNISTTDGEKEEIKERSIDKTPHKREAKFDTNRKDGNGLLPQHSVTTVDTVSKSSGKMSERENPFQKTMAKDDTEKQIENIPLTQPRVTNGDTRTSQGFAENLNVVTTNNKATEINMVKTKDEILAHEGEVEKKDNVNYDNVALPEMAVTTGDTVSESSIGSAESSVDNLHIVPNVGGDKKDSEKLFNDKQTLKIGETKDKDYKPPPKGFTNDDTNVDTDDVNLPQHIVTAGDTASGSSKIRAEELNSLRTIGEHTEESVKEPKGILPTDNILTNDNKNKNDENVSVSKRPESTGNAASESSIDRAEELDSNPTTVKNIKESVEMPKRENFSNKIASTDNKKEHNGNVPLSERHEAIGDVNNEDRGKEANDVPNISQNIEESKDISRDVITSNKTLAKEETNQNNLNEPVSQRLVTAEDTASVKDKGIDGKIIVKTNDEGTKENEEMTKGEIQSKVEDEHGGNIDDKYKPKETIKNDNIVSGGGTERAVNQNIISTIESVSEDNEKASRSERPSSEDGTKDDKEKHNSKVPGSFHNTTISDYTTNESNKNDLEKQHDSLSMDANKEDTNQVTRGKMPSNSGVHTEEATDIVISQTSATSDDMVNDSGKRRAEEDFARGQTHSAKSENGKISEAENTKANYVSSGARKEDQTDLDEEPTSDYSAEHTTNILKTGLAKEETRAKQITLDDTEKGDACDPTGVCDETSNGGLSTEPSASDDRPGQGGNWKELAVKNGVTVPNTITDSSNQSLRPFPFTLWMQVIQNKNTVNKKTTLVKTLRNQYATKDKQTTSEAPNTSELHPGWETELSANKLKAKEKNEDDEEMIHRTGQTYSAKIQLLEMQLLRLENQLLHESLNKNSNTATFSKLENKILTLENELLKINFTFANLKAENDQLKKKQINQASDLAQVKRQGGTSKYQMLADNSTMLTEVILDHQTKIKELALLIQNQTNYLHQLEKKSTQLENQNVILEEQLLNQTKFVEDILSKIENITNEQVAQKEALSRTLQQLELAQSRGTHPEIQEVKTTQPEEGQLDAKQRDIGVMKVESELSATIQSPVIEGNTKSEDSSRKADSSTLQYNVITEKEFNDQMTRSEKHKNLDDEINNNMEKGQLITKNPDADSKTPNIEDEQSAREQEDHLQSMTDRSDEQKQQFIQHSTSTSDTQEPNIQSEHSSNENPLEEGMKMQNEKENIRDKSESHIPSENIVGLSDIREKEEIKTTQSGVNENDMKNLTKESVTKTKPTIEVRRIEPKNMAATDSGYKDCYTHYKKGRKRDTPVKIRPNTSKKDVEVFCDMKNGGWTVIQRRLDGSIDFFKEWEDYKNGFGGIYGEYWLGNDIIHLLTNQDRYTLRVELTDWDRQVFYAEYKYFIVEDESEGYRLHIGDYKGDAGDSMSKHNGQKFSTYDVDNDKAEKDFGGSCSRRFSGAWWYYKCYQSNLNGRYYKGGDVPGKFFDGIAWKANRKANYSFKKVEMKIRPNDAKPWPKV